MSDASTVALSPETVLREMKQNGVTDVVWLPDSETNWLFLLMQADPALRLVGVSPRGARLLDRRRAARGRQEAADPHPKYRDDGKRRFDPRLLLGLNVPVVMMSAIAAGPATASPPTARRPTPSAF